jgi:hypothetical protein
VQGSSTYVHVRFHLIGCVCILYPNTELGKEYVPEMTPAKKKKKKKKNILQDASPQNVTQTPSNPSSPPITIHNTINTNKHRRLGPWEPVTYETLFMPIGPRSSPSLRDASPPGIFPPLVILCSQPTAPACLAPSSDACLLLR